MIQSALLTAALLLASLATPSFSASQDEVLQAQILPGWQAADGSRMAALHLRLAPKWKTYWRSPGDAGIPPRFDWTGSENVASVRYLWPRPVVFHTNGMQTIGYHDELVLPMQIVPRDAARPVVLRGRIDLGICKDICIPAALEMSSELDGAGQPDPAIRAALAARPSTAQEAGLSAIACAVAPSEDGLRLTARMDLPNLGKGETVVFEAGPDIWVDEARASRNGPELVAEAEMVANDRAPFALNRSDITLTVIGPDRAVEIKGCPAP